MHIHMYTYMAGKTCLIIYRIYDQEGNWLMPFWSRKVRGHSSRRIIQNALVSLLSELNIYQVVPNMSQPRKDFLKPA